MNVNYYLELARGVLCKLCCALERGVQGASAAWRMSISGGEADGNFCRVRCRWVGVQAAGA